MARTDRQATLWEISHRMEDLAETVQEVGHELPWDSAAVCAQAGRLLFAEVARMRHKLILESEGLELPGSPGRLL
jgi:hypothetical protein